MHIVLDRYAVDFKVVCAGRVTANSFWGPLVPSIFSSGREGMLFRTIEEDLKDLRAFWNDSFPSDHQATSGFGAADIQELDRAITIKLDLPGMQKENLKVGTTRRPSHCTIQGIYSSGPRLGQACLCMAIVLHESARSSLRLLSLSVST